MQTSVPELMDLVEGIAGDAGDCTARSRARPSFANNCLLARRLVERGVRLVAALRRRLGPSRRPGQPAAGQVPRRRPGRWRRWSRDLKQRGLLDDTLVIWGGEFGRTPLRQGIAGDGTATKPGRDHHKDAFTHAGWPAAASSAASAYGETDDLGFSLVENPVHVHDLNATVLHLLGLDHERLTFKYQGREFRLTDVHGHVVRDLIA